MGQNILPNKFWVKVFRTKQDIVVAICDEEILGREFKFKEVKVKVNEKFYGGKLVDERIALWLIQKGTIINLFGNKIVELALKNHFIKKENTILIDGQLHAQIIKL